MSSALDSAHHLVQAYPGGAEALAPRMGKNATTLRHEVNRTGQAKLGLGDAISMSVLSGDRRILNAFAAECGCVVMALPETLGGDGTAMHRVADLAREFGELVGEVTAAMADGQISANELAAVERNWAELQAAGQALAAHIRAKHESARPGAPA